MRKLLQTLTAGAVVAIPLALLPSGPASAAVACASDHFCAFQNANYGGKLLDSRAASGATVDVANDLVTSVQNRRNNRWDAYNSHAVVSDTLVFRFQAQTNVANVGASANDKIDYFKVH
jgi:hypothetical protein